MYNFNNWYTDYQKRQQLENTIRDMMFRPVTFTNYIRATGDAVNGDDSWLGSFFAPDESFSGEAAEFFTYKSQRFL